MDKLNNTGTIIKHCVIDLGNYLQDNPGEELVIINEIAMECGGFDKFIADYPDEAFALVNDKVKPYPELYEVLKLMEKHSNSPRGLNESLESLKLRRFTLLGFINNFYDLTECLIEDARSESKK